MSGGSDPPLSVQRANSDVSANRSSAGSIPSLPSHLTVLISLRRAQMEKR